MPQTAQERINAVRDERAPRADDQLPYPNKGPKEPRNVQRVREMFIAFHHLTGNSETAAQLAVAAAILTLSDEFGQE